VGEVVDPLMLAEPATGKLMSRLLKKAGHQTSVSGRFEGSHTLGRSASGVCRGALGAAARVGRTTEEVLADLSAARDQSLVSIECRGTAGSRSLKWAHFSFGDLVLAQPWLLQVRHDAEHLEQLRAVKALMSRRQARSRAGLGPPRDRHV